MHKGDYVLADNASFHAKGWAADATRQFLAALGVTYVLLPKYSPELNPVELVFSLLKRKLNSMSFQCNLKDCILQALACVKPRHVIAFYKRRAYI